MITGCGYMRLKPCHDRCAMGGIMGILNNIQRLIEDNFVAYRAQSKVEVLNQYTIHSHPGGGVRRSIVVTRIPRSYWEEQGWQQKGGKYDGMFQTRYGSWAGYATQSPSGRVEIFIRNPPKALEHHPHWSCFNKRKDGWFSVHPTRPIADVSAAIINVEKTITEAYEN